MFAEEPDVFLADFGVDCAKGAVTFKGLLDTPDDTVAMQGASVISRAYALTIKTSDATGNALAHGTALTVNGMAMVVREVLRLDDGAFTQLTLTRT